MQQEINMKEAGSGMAEAIGALSLTARQLLGSIEGRETRLIKFGYNLEFLLLD